MNTMESAFERKIDLSKFEKGQTVCVAFSGGADSSALLFYLKKAEARLGIRLRAIHVEHGIRGEASKKDAEFAKNVCEKLGVPLTLFGVDAPKEKAERKITLEEAARALRYRAFSNEIEAGANAVVLAHHADDAAETIFMHIMRGTGIAGLCPMKNELPFLRPLLNVTREEIEEYVKENAVPFVSDETNRDTLYTRNFLRECAFPLLAQRFEPRESLLRLSRAAAEDEKFISAFLTPPIITAQAEVELPLSGAHCQRALAFRNILNAFRALGVYQDIETRHLELIYDLCEKENGKYLEMPHGVNVSKAYDKLMFRLRKNRTAAQTAFSKAFCYLGNNYKVKKWTGHGLRFDLDKIPVGALVRGRKEGDRFTPFRGKEKSLSDYLIDKKIPRAKRDELMLIALENEDWIKADDTTRFVACVEKETV